MRISYLGLGLAATLGMAQGAGAALTVPAVGVVDPTFSGPVNNQTNPSINSGVVSSEAGMTVATWQSRIGTAFANQLGGVWNGSSPDIDDAAGNTGGGSSNLWNITIATGKTFDLGATDTAQISNTAFASANPISGYHAINSNDQIDAAWGISLALTGFDPAAKITELGFANIGRSNATNSVVFTVTYDNLTTATTGNLAALTQTNARLVHFLAPAGLGITRLDMTTTSSRGIQLDDLGVIVTVPEPASLSLLGLGGLAMLRRRRT